MQFLISVKIGILSYQGHKVTFVVLWHSGKCDAFTVPWTLKNLLYKVTLLEKCINLCELVRTFAPHTNLKKCVDVLSVKEY